MALGSATGATTEARRRPAAAGGGSSIEPLGDGDRDGARDPPLVRDAPPNAVGCPIMGSVEPTAEPPGSSHAPEPRASERPPANPPLLFPSPYRGDTGTEAAANNSALCCCSMAACSRATAAARAAFSAAISAATACASSVSERGPR